MNSAFFWPKGKGQTPSGDSPPASARRRPSAAGILKKYWVVLALFLIFLTAFQVRMTDYRWDYLRNIDSYVFYRWMDEIVINNGALPDHDAYILAPVGFDRPQQWLYPYFYLGAYSYLAYNSLFPTTLLAFLIPFPAFLAALSVIPVYFMGKLLYDRKAGVLAAFFYAFDISNISRSLGGDPDSDAIMILFQVIVMAFFIYNFKLAEKSDRFGRKLWLSTIATSIVFALWYALWAGYWYIFWLVIGFVGLRFIVELATRRNFSVIRKPVYLSFIALILISFALTVPPYGITKITSALAGPIDFSSIKGEDTEFPNVYVSVAELQQGGDIAGIVQRTSALQGAAILISPFFLMIYALIYLIYSYLKSADRKNIKHIDTVLLMLIWVVGPLLATVVAIRFSILFSAPIALGSGILLSKVVRMALKHDKKWSD